MLFTLGVAVDYGIYAATTPGQQSRTIGLCALTTIGGAGSLVLGQHPALRWLGITLIAGIAGGYLTSCFIVTPLTRVSANRVVRYAMTAVLLLLTLLLVIPPVTEILL